MSWDCSLIRSRLYLGGISCALDPGVPFALGVRSILSLTDATAAEQVRSVQAVACSEIVFKHVDLEDSSDADLLSHLEECTNFVATGLATSRGSVLVHCIAGVSRSAAVVVAYLMKSEGLRLEEALHSVKKIRPQVSPNVGFMEQLRLFEEMSNRAGESSLQFRQYRLRKLAASIQAGEKEVPSAVLVPDPSSTLTHSHSLVLHKCRTCRRLLFTADGVLDHEPGKGAEAFSWQKRIQQSHGVASQSSLSAVVCSSYFTEPVEWMSEALRGVVEGKLLCPKCNSRVGAFNWAGMQCSCGRWITPAFQFHRNRVDDTKFPLGSSLSTTVKEPV